MVLKSIKRTNRYTLTHLNSDLGLGTINSVHGSGLFSTIKGVFNKAKDYIIKNKDTIFEYIKRGSKFVVDNKDTIENVASVVSNMASKMGQPAIASAAKNAVSGVSKVAEKINGGSTMDSEAEKKLKMAVASQLSSASLRDKSSEKAVPYQQETNRLDDNGKVISMLKGKGGRIKNGQGVKKSAKSKEEKRAEQIAKLISGINPKTK